MKYIPFFTKWHSPLPHAPLTGAPERVILLHGIARNSAHMSPLTQYLTAQGFETHSLDYPSTDYQIKDLIGLMSAQIAPLLTPERVTHFVGYSMGGLLVRGIIDRLRPAHLGQIVQLGAPNGGSEVASFLKPFPPYQLFFGPAGQELAKENSADLNAALGEVKYTLGVIAGNKTFDPISSMLIDGEDDGKVSVEATKLPGMRDHITLPVTHLHFPKYEIVHYQTAYFLKNGQFDLNNVAP